MAVKVRYIVDDVDAAISFYTGALGFKVEMHPAPGFAAVSRGDLHLTEPAGCGRRRPIHAGWPRSWPRGMEPHSNRSG